MSETVRPTKKQRDLLTYIEHFIKEHGYSPSYREIMNGLSYTSVATVALHVNSLITRGHLRKRDRSARSLEVVDEARSAGAGSSTDIPSATASDSQAETWLVAKITTLLGSAEQAANVSPQVVEELVVLRNAFQILGFADSSQLPAGLLFDRIEVLRQRADSNVE